MWCATCQAEVAAEVSSNRKRVQCVNCGADIAAAHISETETTRQARELLERWSDPKLLDPYGPLPKMNVDATGQSAAPAARVDESKNATTEPPPAQPTPQPKFRIDSSHQPINESTPDHQHKQVNRAQTAENRNPAAQNSFQIHGAHQGGIQQPHFELPQTANRKQSRWTAPLGQYLAYFGVLLLTVGTATVISGYFGGPATYAPTGWLVATVGQMLLFLGIVTLISGGMEQTNTEVKTRIERLGAQIYRFEKASLDQTLRGPKLPSQAYGNDQSVPAHDSATQQAFANFD